MVKSIFDGMQKLGRALMLPIAVLPVAALLLRLGQDDLLGVQAVAAAGGAIFSNLGILFAIGVAVADVAFRRGLTKMTRPDDLVEHVRARMYDPAYVEYLPAS